MRILDRYLLKMFLMPWLTCVVGFSFLFIIVALVIGGVVVVVVAVFDNDTVRDLL